MPMGNGAAGVAGSPLPKWQLALAVGAPVALGLGYMYYRNTTARSDRESTKDAGKSNRTTRETQKSIDSDCSEKIDAPSETETAAERAQRYKIHGNAKFKAGKFDQAIELYNKAIESCPEENTVDLAAFYQNRAAAYEQLKKYTAVKEDCTKALELKPKYAKALLRRARAMEKLNELELVLEDLTAACILEEFQNQSTLHMADQVLKKLGKQHAQELLQKKEPVMPSPHFVKTYMSSFRRDPFVPVNSESTAEDDIAIEALEAARQALKEQRYDDIIAICTKAIKREGPKDLAIEMQLRLLRAIFQIFLGQLETARDDLSIVIKDENSSNAVKINALINRASVFMQLELHEECFADYKSAIKIEPDCSDIYYHRGQLHLLLDNMDEAKEDWAMAFKLNPTSDIVYAQMCYVNVRYAMTKRSTKLMEEAMEAFREGIENFPNSSDCHTLYARVLADTQEFDDADNHFEKAFEKDPTNSTILVHRGLLHVQARGDVARGVEYIRKALEVDDKSAFGYEILATIEVQRGNLQQAIDLFDRALALGRSAAELAHIFSLQDAAKAQLKVVKRLGLKLNFGPQGTA